MAAPFSVSFRTHGLTLQPSPLFAAVIAKSGTGMSENVPVGKMTVVDEAEALGSDGHMRIAFDYMKQFSDFHFVAMPYDGEDAAAVAASLASTSNLLADGTELAKLDGYAPSVVVIPELSAGDPATNADIAKVAGHAAKETRRIGAVFVDAAGDTSANALAWATANQKEGIVGVVNKATIPGAGDGNGWGSIIAAGHFLRHVGADDLRTIPFTTRYPVGGVSDPSPVVVFDPESATAAAEAYDDVHLTSLIRYDGGIYCWGGKSGDAAAADAFTFPTHRVAAFQLVKGVRHLMLPYVNGEVTSEDLDILSRGLALISDDYVERRYVTGYAYENLRVSNRHLSVRLELNFPDVLESVGLDISTAAA
ncbi:MAG: hypothetical protein OXD46_05140 [Chloroflexi bacterium]|nr:hypothetical protein [Chloroflexota bacterium]